MEESTEVNLRKVWVKWRSKKELFDFLSTDWDVFLPPIQYANASYVRGIVTGQLQVIVESYKSGKIAYLFESSKGYNVPTIKSLETEEIIKYAKTKFELDNYLPKYWILRLPNRPWLCTLSKLYISYSL